MPSITDQLIADLKQNLLDDGHAAEDIAKLSVSDLWKLALDEGQPSVNSLSTTAALAAIGNAINTTGKAEGKQVFNTTTNKPAWAVGSAAGDVWVNADGTTAHTPV